MIFKEGICMSKHRIEFQPAKTIDAERLAFLRKQIREDTYRGIYTDAMLDEYDMQQNIEWFVTQIEVDAQKLFIILADGEVAGYLGVGKPIYWYPDGAGREELFLNSLYISKEFWRRGIGRTAMQFVFQTGKTQSKHKLYNNCNYHNKSAFAFYRACGGRVTCWECGHQNRAEDQVTFEYLIT